MTLGCVSPLARHANVFSSPANGPGYPLNKPCTGNGVAPEAKANRRGLLYWKDVGNGPAPAGRATIQCGDKRSVTHFKATAATIAATDFRALLAIRAVANIDGNLEAPAGRANM